jgi:protein-serine/threonine kinase
VRQAKPRIRPQLGLHTGDASVGSSHSLHDSAGPITPISLPQEDDDEDDQDEELVPPQAPFQQLRGKASYDSLNSNPTSRSQSSTDLQSRPQDYGRKPSGSGAAAAGDGFRGFQFPLSKAAMASRPAPMQRGLSAAPQSTQPLAGPSTTVKDTLSPTRPGLPRMQSAMPDMQSDPTPPKPARPQISINLPPRPPMMRHASAAVMEGRAQAQAQAHAHALAAVDEGPLSPNNRNLGVPAVGGRPQIGLGVAVSGPGAGVGMSRSRSGSRTEDHNVGLRDLMRVGAHVISDRLPYRSS